jgi:hypothetical protein
MNNPSHTLMMIVMTVLIVLTFNNNLLVGESPEPDSKESFLTYNDTISGITINYPSSWEIFESGSESLISLLENMTSSEPQTVSHETASKLMNVLESFGLEKVSEILGLKNEKRVELLKALSQQLNEGKVQVIVSVYSPRENEFDFAENMNIQVEDISSRIPLSVNDYTSQGIENANSVFPSYKVSEPMKEIVVDGRPAIRYAYQFTEGTESIKGLQVLTIKDNMVYVLTFTTTADKYSIHLPIFENMLDSFKLSPR